MSVFTVEETPASISPHIKSFCETIQKDQRPIFVPVVPTSTAIMQECFYSVAQHCEQAGGEIVYGWNIWTWPHLWLKAEHHAVWRAPDGALIDITPKPNQVSQIVFLPDPARQYDFEKNMRLMNITRALKSDADILELFAAEKCFFDYEEKATTVGSLAMSVDPKIYFPLKKAKEDLLMKLALKYLRGGQNCPCRSGERFSACHKPQFTERLGQA